MRQHLTTHAYYAYEEVAAEPAHADKISPAHVKNISGQSILNFISLG